MPHKVQGEDATNGAMVTNNKIFPGPGTSMKSNEMYFSAVETDAIRSPDHTVTAADCFWTFSSIVSRLFAIVMNIILAVKYFNQGEMNHFRWTVSCIVVSMLVTTFIHVCMLHQDGKFHGCRQSLQTFLFVLLPSFFLRYLMTFKYTIECMLAERRQDRGAQRLSYQRMVSEEADVAFIRLFECFMETAPQKIVLICIMLTSKDKISYNQIISLVLYICGTAWSLALYHRCIRYSQPDKSNISAVGCFLHLCWHFSISFSRSLCIALVAFMFPVWTIIACICHTILCGFCIFIVERPIFAEIANSCGNFLICLAMGAVHLFTFISVKEGKTRYKYIIYYTLCMMENIACVVIFCIFVNAVLGEISIYKHILLCTSALGSYVVGIVLMIIYYKYYHPSRVHHEK